MSLDVYLTKRGERVVRGGARIYVRENGATREMSREEWDARNSGVEPVTFTGEDESDRVYEANITHNLTRMASEAGIYEALWQPEEIGAKKASDLIELLNNGLARLALEPEKFKAFNPDNGWGNYEALVVFVREYLAACREHPDAGVSVWR